jgi:hypothetical protein
MIAIQPVSAQIGRVTVKGIIANVRDFAPRWLVISDWDSAWPEHFCSDLSRDLCNRGDNNLPTANVF